jgi:ABC-type Zn uptake system ZnuABC Zn-binding protein ZnuA
MSSNVYRRGFALMFLVVLISSFSLLFAGGGAESPGQAIEDYDEHDHDHDDDHDGGMVIPEIAPAQLSADNPLSVVASTSIIGDVVSRIAGDAAQVDVLMPRGQNPHSYEPTPRAMAAVEGSYIVFVNGLDLEEVLMEAIENVAGSYIVPVSAGIAVLDGEGHDHDDDDHNEDDGHDHDDDDHGEDEHHEEDDHDHGAGDPHFWFDPNNVIIWAENIADALISADPANADTYAANRDAYIAELEALDLEVRNLVASVPRARRKLVVDHVTLDYFAQEYGFEVIGEVIPSVSDQAEPSARDIARLAEEIREEGVRTIFIGGTAGRGLQNLVQAVADEVGEDVSIVSILTGSLAPAGSRGDSYLDFVRYNAEQIVSGLLR